MNMIYDLVLNFQDIFHSIEFYEWKKDDAFTYIKKIPIVCVHTLQLNELYHSVFRISHEKLEEISHKTFTSTGTLSYALLITDYQRVFAFLFDESGLSIKRSSLLLDEESAVMEEAMDFSLEELSFEKIDSISYCCFLTRNEKKIQGYLLHKLQSLYQEEKYDEIRYLYYEVFQKPQNIHKQYTVLIDSIQNHFSSEFYSLYDILQLAQ